MRKMTLLFAVSAMLMGTTTNAQTIDGSRAGDAYGSAISVQQTQSEFGDSMGGGGGSELNAAYAYNDGTTLYLMFTGNLESNFNKLNVFIDSVAGGENVITPDVNNGGSNPDNDSWAARYSGLTFDTGFEADFLVICRNGNFEGDRFDLDFNSVGDASVVESATDVFGGTTTGSNGMLPNGIMVGFDNSNDLGVAGGTEAADQAAAELVETGVELAIPLAAIGATAGDTIKLCVHINGSNHDFLSNQFLGALEPDQGNLGGDGMGNFTGDLSLVDLTTLPGDQCFSVTIGGGGGPTIVRGASLNVTRGTLNMGGLVELADSDNADLSIFRASSDVLSRTEFEVEAVSPTETPTTFDVTLEGSVFARNTVNQAIDLWDFDAAAWEEVDTQAAMRFSDSTVTVTPTGDLSRFVETGVGTIRARVRFRSPINRQRFTSNTDQFIWTIE